MNLYNIFGRPPGILTLGISSKGLTVEPVSVAEMACAAATPETLRVCGCESYGHWL